MSWQLSWSYFLENFHHVVLRCFINVHFRLFPWCPTSGNEVKLNFPFARRKTLKSWARFEVFTASALDYHSQRALPRIPSPPVIHCLCATSCTRRCLFTCSRESFHSFLNLLFTISFSASSNDLIEFENPLSCYSTPTAIVFFSLSSFEARIFTNVSLWCKEVSMEQHKKKQIKRHTRWKLRFKRYLISFFALSRSPRFCFSLSSPPSRSSEFSRVFYEIPLLVFCSNFYADRKSNEQFRKCVIILFCSSS